MVEKEYIRLHNYIMSHPDKNGIEEIIEENNEDEELAEDSGIPAYKGSENNKPRQVKRFIFLEHSGYWFFLMAKLFLAICHARLFHKNWLQKSNRQKEGKIHTEKEKKTIEIPSCRELDSSMSLLLGQLIGLLKVSVLSGENKHYKRAIQSLLCYFGIGNHTNYEMVRPRDKKALFSLFGNNFIPSLKMAGFNVDALSSLCPVFVRVTDTPPKLEQDIPDYKELVDRFLALDKSLCECHVEFFCGNLTGKEAVTLAQLLKIHVKYTAFFFFVLREEKVSMAGYSSVNPITTTTTTPTTTTIVSSTPSAPISTLPTKSSGKYPVHLVCLSPVRLNQNHVIASEWLRTIAQMLGGNGGGNTYTAQGYGITDNDIELENARNNLIEFFLQKTKKE